MQLNAFPPSVPTLQDMQKQGRLSLVTYILGTTWGLRPTEKYGKPDAALGKHRPASSGATPMLPTWAWRSRLLIVGQMLHDVRCQCSRWSKLYHLRTRPAP